MIQWVAVVLALLWLVAIGMAVFERSRRKPIAVAPPAIHKRPEVQDGELEAAKRLIHEIAHVPLLEHIGDARGIVIPAGGEGYAHCLRLTLEWLRTSLPIEVWAYERELDSIKWASDRVTIRLVPEPGAGACKHAIKSYALANTGFRHAILIEADAVPLISPEYLFETHEYKESGALFWSSTRIGPQRSPLGYMPHALDTSVIAIDTKRHGRAIQMVSHVAGRWGARLYEWTGTRTDAALWSIIWSESHSPHHIIHGQREVGHGSPWAYSATVLSDTNHMPLFIHARGARWSGVPAGKRVLHTMADGTPFSDVAGDFESRFNTGSFPK